MCAHYYLHCCCSGAPSSNAVSVVPRRVVAVFCRNGDDESAGGGSGGGCNVTPPPQATRGAPEPCDHRDEHLLCALHVVHVVLVVHSGDVRCGQVCLATSRFAHMKLDCVAQTPFAFDLFVTNVALRFRRDCCGTFSTFALAQLLLDGFSPMPCGRFTCSGLVHRSIPLPPVVAADTSCTHRCISAQQ